MSGFVSDHTKNQDPTLEVLLVQDCSIMKVKAKSQSYQSFILLQYYKK